MAQRAEDRLVQRRPLLPCFLLLLLAEQPSHGYELAERLKKWGFELAGPGPVYRELRVLEEGALVRSAWSPSHSGPVPRVYELTVTGRRALNRCAEELEEMGALLRAFRDHHGQLVSAPEETHRRRRRSGT
jgi:PadR family transcriptional regulator PadR